VSGRQGGWRRRGISLLIEDRVREEGRG
jgi:hypothetical protein